MGSPKECFPGCENALGKLSQKGLATVVTKFTKPGMHFFGDPCCIAKLITKSNQELQNTP